MFGRRDTNTTTHFLRELRALQIVRDLVAKPNTAAGRKTVVWSIGCSSGDEPYGLAMLCREAGANVEILATDINPEISSARSGRATRSATCATSTTSGAPAGSGATAIAGSWPPSCARW